MKDVPHHMMKFMRKMAQPDSQQTKEDEELKKELHQEPSKHQIRKQKKAKMRKDRKEHIPIHDDEDERNKKMRKRVPRFYSRSHKQLGKTTNTK